MGIDTPPITPQQYEVLHGGGAEAAEIAQQRLSRRRFLRRSMLAVWGISGTAAVAGALAMLYPGVTSGFGGLINVGTKDEFKAALPAAFQGNQAGVFYRPLARSYIIHLTADTSFLLNGIILSEQMGTENMLKDPTDGSYWLALYQVCVHLGCTVPFKDNCISFKCPCHGSHYNVTGEYLDGPAPRSLDRFSVVFQNGDVMVDTGALNQKVPRPDETTRLVAPPAVACTS